MQSSLLPVQFDPMAMVSLLTFDQLTSWGPSTSTLLQKKLCCIKGHKTTYMHCDSCLLDHKVDKLCCFAVKYMLLLRKAILACAAKQDKENRRPSLCTTLANMTMGLSTTQYSGWSQDIETSQDQVTSM